MFMQYANLIGRGMVRTSALIVIAKKLLRIIYAMVRDSHDYIGNYEISAKVGDKRGSIGDTIRRRGDLRFLPLRRLSDLPLQKQDSPSTS